MFKYFSSIGPGLIVTAAFIGPGTVTVCLMAGNQFGFALLWAILFAITTTIVLQEMSARLGLVTGGGLSDAIRRIITLPVLRFVCFGLIVLGILVGNAAYEAGNITGTLIGLRQFIGPDTADIWLNTIVYVPAFMLLFFGTYKVFEFFFISIVGLMSLSFLIAAYIFKPSVTDLLNGFFKPDIPPHAILTIIALVGTTVVPYNLFLHSAMIGRKWKDLSDLHAVRKDTLISIVVGGIISVCIIITGGATYGQNLHGIHDLGTALEPLYGVTGRYVFGFGIFSAGFTSTITAPLAASLVARGLFGWSEEKDSIKIKMVWIAVLTSGFIMASLGYKPVDIIRMAQVTNGMLLPIIAAFLIWAVNQSGIMKEYTNTKWQNILGAMVLMITLGLSMKSFGLF